MSSHLIQIKDMYERWWDDPDDRGDIMNMWAFVKKYIVDELPVEMTACADCADIDCRDQQYLTCRVRLTGFTSAGDPQHTELWQASRST
jgi:hypothetical protein